MSLDDNKAVVRRFYDAYARGDEATYAPLLDRNIRATMLEPSHPLGYDDLLAYGRSFLAGFPDARITVDEMVAEADIVAVRGKCSGTHRGEFEGLPPTGKSMQIQFQSMVRIVNGKIVELWEVDDMLSMMQQLGALPV